ncbi:aldose 1-epimerase [Spirosomataceae bacterium TFI 002]|nr:aldose 1-epimerase [Spirosomataceae bacterium TFI 002]
MPVKSLKIDDQNYLEVEQSQGASLSLLVLGGNDIIKFPLKEDDTKKGYPSALLFPFPNRIKDGRYDFEGKSYQLDINEDAFNHAIHGLVAFENFEMTHSDSKSFTFAYDYKGQEAGYPFPFLFEVKYTLRKLKLSVDVNFENTGKTNMPYGFAWHPYFGFEGVSIGEVEVKVPVRHDIKLDDRMIPTGEKEMQNAKLISLKNSYLDNLFEIDEKEGLKEVELRFQNKKVIISQNAAENQLPYFIAYTPPSRDCIAVEPQSCATNAFNNGLGLKVLKPGKSKNYKFSVRIEI